jgi:hypothetical protein
MCQEPTVSASFFKEQTDAESQKSALLLKRSKLMCRELRVRASFSRSKLMPRAEQIELVFKRSDTQSPQRFYQEAN